MRWQLPSKTSVSNTYIGLPVLSVLHEIDTLYLNFAVADGYAVSGFLFHPNPGRVDPIQGGEFGNFVENLPVKGKYSVNELAVGASLGGTPGEHQLGNCRAVCQFLK